MPPHLCQIQKPQNKVVVFYIIMSFCIGKSTPRTPTRGVKERCSICNVSVFRLAKHKKSETHKMAQLKITAAALCDRNEKLWETNAKLMADNERLQSQLLTACKYIERSSFTFPKFSNPPPPYTTGGFRVSPPPRENPGKRRRVTTGPYIPPHRRTVF